MSKALATIATQPLIVAKVGLQSRPPLVRKGKPFKSFVEVMSYIIEHEGPLALFKGIGPQITKGVLVQGFLMMTKERYSLRLFHNEYLLLIRGRMEILFIALFAYIRKVRSAKLQQATKFTAVKAKQMLPLAIAR